jgi:hypothetical protein
MGFSAGGAPWKRFMRALRRLLTPRQRMRNLSVGEHAADWHDAFLAEMAPWVASGEDRYREKIREGFEVIPTAFAEMLRGENFGKTLVRVTTDPTLASQLERRQDQLREEIVAAGTPEVLPALHPNLAQVYRQKVERLEEALHDPVVSAAAVEALRSPIDAIVVHPANGAGRCVWSCAATSLRSFTWRKKHRTQPTAPASGTAVLGE